MSETEQAAAPTDDHDVEAEAEAEVDDEYRLDDLPDGSGCAEIWDHLSESRRGD